MFSSLSNLVWGAPEEQAAQNNTGEVSFDDSKVIEDDWVLVEEITNESRQEQDGSSCAQEDERVPSLQALFEENKPEFSGSTKESDPGPGSSSENENSDSLNDNAKKSLEDLLAAKQSDTTDKSSLEILFAAVQPNDSENKDDSDCSMKTDETDFGEKSSLQFLFDESLNKEGTSAGNNSSSVFTLKPLPDPPVILAPNTGSRPEFTPQPLPDLPGILAPNTDQSRHLYNKSCSADYYREQPETVEPTVLRRRHVTRASKRSGEGAAAMEGHVVLQKRNKQPSEGTSGVGRGEETRRRTRRANSVACGQLDNTHGKRRKRTAEKFSGKGGRRNC